MKNIVLKILVYVLAIIGVISFLTSCASSRELNSHKNGMPTSEIIKDSTDSLKKVDSPILSGVADTIITPKLSQQMKKKTESEVVTKNEVKLARINARKANVESRTRRVEARKNAKNTVTASKKDVKIAKIESDTKSDSLKADIKVKKIVSEENKNVAKSTVKQIKAESAVDKLNKWTNILIILVVFLVVLFSGIVVVILIIKRR